MISIVIPVWGSYERYLPECLDCIKKQTSNNYEVIISRIPNLSGARNEAISKARGEYIFAYDVDDIIDETYIEEVEKETADIITTEHKEFEDHQALGGIPDDFTLENVINGRRPIACSVFKKKLWENIGGYDTNFDDGFEDWDFWLRAAKAGASYKKIGKVLYYQRKHGDSMSVDIHKDVNKLKKIADKHPELYGTNAFKHIVF